MKALTTLILTAAFLSACAGGSASRTNEFEEYPLREANKEESAKLKHCLRSAQKAQEQRKQKTSKYYGRASDIPVGGACDDFTMTQKRTPDGYEIMAQFSENESTVRWTVNQDGVIEEYLDTEMEDMDLEF